MEALDMPILIRLAPHPSGGLLRRLYVAAAPFPRRTGRNVELLDLLLSEPILDGVGHKLPRFARPSGCLRQAIYAMLRFATVVATDVFGCTVAFHGRLNNGDDIDRSDIPCHMHCFPLTSVFVHQGQDSEVASVLDLISHEAPAPNMVRPACSLPLCGAFSNSLHLPLFPAHSVSLFSPDSSHSLGINLKAFSPQ